MSSQNFTFSMPIDLSESKRRAQDGLPLPPSGIDTMMDLDDNPWASGAIQNSPILEEHDYDSGQHDPATSARSDGDYNDWPMVPSGNKAIRRLDEDLTENLWSEAPGSSKRLYVEVDHSQLLRTQLRVQRERFAQRPTHLSEFLLLEQLKKQKLVINKQASSHASSHAVFEQRLRGEFLEMMKEREAATRAEQRASELRLEQEFSAELRAVARKEEEFRAEIARVEAETKQELERKKAELDVEIERMRAETKQELERKKAELNVEMERVRVEKENELAAFTQKQARIRTPEKTPSRLAEHRGGSTSRYTPRLNARAARSYTPRTTLHAYPAEEESNRKKRHESPEPKEMHRAPRPNIRVGQSSKGKKRAESPESQEVIDIPSDDDSDSDIEVLRRSEERLLKTVESTIRKTMGKMNIGQTPGKPASSRRRPKAQVELENEKAQDQRWHRTAFLAHIRELFKDAFNVESDADFVVHGYPPAEDIKNFDQGIGPGPDAADLKLDMKGGPRSGWNRKIVEILLDKLIESRDHAGGWPGLPERSEAYLIDMIEEKIQRIKHNWKSAQPQIDEAGNMETLSDVEDRMIVEQEERGKYTRRGTRRREKYKRRIKTVETMIEIKEDAREGDINVWRWLKDVLEHLGEDGMSSEDSSVEGELNTSVYRVKLLLWRRNIDRELDIIDKQRFKDKEIYSPRGSKPGIRIRGTGNPITDRPPVSRLPEIFYDGEWLQEQSATYRRLTLHVSKEQFRWLKVVAR